MYRVQLSHTAQGALQSGESASSDRSCRMLEANVSPSVHPLCSDNDANKQKVKLHRTSNASLCNSKWLKVNPEYLLSFVCDVLAVASVLTWTRDSC